MNKKGSMKFIISMVLALVLLAVAAAIIFRGVAKPATDITSCPTEERCMESCTAGLIVDSNRLCKDKDKHCCLTLQEKLGEVPLPGKKTETGSGTGTGTGTGDNSGTGSGSAGIETDTKIIIKDAEDATLPEWKSLSVLKAESGTTYKFNVWLTGTKQICSINVREVVERDSGGRIIKTERIDPSWFRGDVTRAVCNSTNKQTVEITFPAPLSESEIGKEYKMDVMAFTDTNLATEFTTSASIFIKPQGVAIVENVPPAQTDDDDEVLQPIPPETCNNQQLAFNTYTGVTTIVPIQSGATFTKHCEADINDYGDDTYLYLKMVDNGCNRMCRITLVDTQTSNQGLLAYQYVTGLSNQLVPCDGHRVNFEFPQQCTATQKNLKLYVDSYDSLGISNHWRDEFTVIVNP